MVENTKRRGRPTNAELKAELIELRELKKNLEANATSVSDPSVHVQENVEEVDSEYYDEFDQIKIGQEEYIKVICLCPMPLNLSTLGRGKGKVFKFSTGYGEVKRILYGDLVMVMEEHPNFLNEGYFFIADRRVVRKHGLDDIYDKILSKQKIDEIISGDKNVALDILRGASPKQQEFVCDLIIGKLISEQPIYLNLVHRVSDIAGIRILEKVEEAKLYAESS